MRSVIIVFVLISVLSISVTNGRNWRRRWHGSNDVPRRRGSPIFTSLGKRPWERLPTVGNDTTNSTSMNDSMSANTTDSSSEPLEPRGREFGQRFFGRWNAGGRGRENLGGSDNNRRGLGGWIRRFWSWWGNCFTPDQTTTPVAGVTSELPPEPVTATFPEIPDVEIAEIKEENQPRYKIWGH